MVLQTQLRELKQQINLLQQNLMKSEAKNATLKEEILYVRSKSGLHVEVSDNATDEVGCYHRLKLLRSCRVCEGPSAMSQFQSYPLLELIIPLKLTPFVLVYSRLFWSKHQNLRNRLRIHHPTSSNQKLERGKIGRVVKLRLYRRQFKLQIGLVVSDIVLLFSSSLFCWLL